LPRSTIYNYNGADAIFQKVLKIIKKSIDNQARIYIYFIPAKKYTYLQGIMAGLTWNGRSGDRLGCVLLKNIGGTSV